MRDYSKLYEDSNRTVYEDEMKKDDFSIRELEINDVFFPLIDGFYRAICLYNGIVSKKCPNNENSLCKTKLIERPRNLYHVWDGRNGWKCPCG